MNDIKQKIKKELKQINKNIDDNKQKINLIKDQPNKKELLRAYYGDQRVERAKLKLLNQLIK